MHCCKLNLRLLRHFTKPIARSQRYTTPAVQSTNENSSLEPIPINKVEQLEVNKVDQLELEIDFPPIEDLSILARKRREREKWHDKMKKLGTVEEKIFELNMPMYYGWKVYEIKEGIVPYDSLSHAQYVTRTHLVDKPGLPDCYNNIVSSETLEALVQKIKNPIQDALVFEYNFKRQEYQFDSDQLQDKVLMDSIMAKAVTQQINRILTTHLSPSHSHLLETEIDMDPRHEAFWFFGGYEVPYELKKRRKAGYAKEWADSPVNQCLHYTGTPILQLRHNLPMKEIISIEESEDPSLKIPVESLDPRQYGFFRDRRRATVIPGFWPGDHSEFGFISYHNRGELPIRPEHYNDAEDAIKTQAVFGSFGWLYGQACYQGFSTFQDPTYPLVNQAVITNGQWWSFSVYQLNCLAMHVDAINENPRKNICWITEPMKLFENINNDKVEGFNEEVLKNLIKFYVNAPQSKEGVEMKPYLSHGSKLIANIEDPERRIWLESRYKHLMSNRARHRLPPEIHHWEWIYKIKFKTRPLDKKREPWEFGINPYNRRLDEHTPEYIPQCKRPYFRSKKKWAKTFYPSVEDNSIHEHWRYHYNQGSKHILTYKKMYKHK